MHIAELAVGRPTFACMHCGKLYIHMVLLSAVVYLPIEKYLCCGCWLDLNPLNADTTYTVIVVLAYESRSSILMFIVST